MRLDSGNITHMNSVLLHHTLILREALRKHALARVRDVCGLGNLMRPSTHNMRILPPLLAGSPAGPSRGQCGSTSLSAMVMWTFRMARSASVLSTSTSSLSPRVADGEWEAKELCLRAEARGVSACRAQLRSLRGLSRYAEPSFADTSSRSTN